MAVVALHLNKRPKHDRCTDEFSSSAVLDIAYGDARRHGPALLTGLCFSHQIPPYVRNCHRVLDTALFQEVQ